MRFPKRPTKREMQAQAAFYSGDLSQMPEYKEPVKRGKQKESAVGEANRKTARLLGGVLYRNRRGMLPLPNGGMLPIGLGPNGFPDECGHLTITITPEFLGRKVAIAWYVEDKTDEGVVAEHQLRCIEELRDAGAIAGVSRGPEDLQAMVEKWRAGK